MNLRFAEAADGGVVAYPVPIRSMSGDGNVGGSAIDHVVSIGVNSVIATLEQVLACHLESLLQLEMRCCGGWGR